MAPTDKAELISFDDVKQALQRALMDTKKIENLPDLPSKIQVAIVAIQDCYTTKDKDTIRVQGRGWVDLQLVYGNTEIGEFETNEDFPITYSAEFRNDKTLLSCNAVANTDRFYGREEEEEVEV
jgi:hypothetical protein